MVPTVPQSAARWTMVAAPATVQIPTFVLFVAKVTGKSAFAKFVVGFCTSFAEGLVRATSFATVALRRLASHAAKKEGMEWLSFDFIKLRNVILGPSYCKQTSPAAKIANGI